ncbi:MAG: cellulase family glycosylhydrolase [Defluviitaleaceae bacterium]|nr:cellulase family glycosylhydrolase [Defluviitaleaceae bacterium]
MKKMKVPAIFVTFLAMVLLFPFGFSVHAEESDGQLSFVYHTVLSGETLSTIAQDMMGASSPSNINALLEANNFPSPTTRVLVGSIIRVPIIDPRVGPVSAEQIVSMMGVGWNLGNTLDAHPHGNEEYMHPDVPLDVLETLWGNPVTTLENITAIREAGFNTIRIPVTWYNKLIGDDNFTVRPDWMDRVQQVVDYAVENDFIIIINTHHDERLFSLLDEEMDESLRALVSLWEQISERFRDYNHMLIFEGLNEPRTIGSPNEWGGGTPEEHVNINTLNQTFVDTVRASGGNNVTRVLMVPTYAAAAMPLAIEGFEMPTDPVNQVEKIAVSIHTYAPYWFALHLGDARQMEWDPENPDDTGPIVWHFGLLYDAFISNGIPVVLGEMGALNRDNLQSRVDWTYFYTRHAGSMGIPVIWWDNGRSYGVSLYPADGDFFGILERSDNTFPFPEIIDALLRAIE